MTKQAAPLSRRFLALGVDYLIILSYGVLLFCCTILFYQLVFGGIPNVLDVLGRGGSQFLGIVTLTLPIGVYLYLTESGSRHATLGKRALKLQITAISGKSVSRKQIVLRTIMKLLPWEFAHTFVYQVVYYSQDGGTPPLWVMIGLIAANVLPLIYVLAILLRKDRRGPHDLVAATIVTTIRS